MTRLAYAALHVGLGLLFVMCLTGRFIGDAAPAVGVGSLLFPELVASPVMLTNAGAIRARAAALLAAFPDFHLERVELVIDGERHADRWVMTGTHRGELFGLPPTGRTVRVEGATFTRLGPYGLVVEDVHHSDLAGLFAQLGGS